MIWGGAKRMGGGKRTRERALPKIFGPSKRASGLLCRGFLYRTNRALAPERGWKTYRTRGVQNPFLGGGVIREVFHPPLFSTPPWRPLKFWMFLIDSAPSKSPGRKDLFIQRHRHHTLDPQSSMAQDRVPPKRSLLLHAEPSIPQLRVERPFQGITCEIRNFATKDQNQSLQVVLLYQRDYQRVIEENP